MPSAEPAILEARGLGKRFGASPVLRGLDFSIAPGQILLVLGENGSGKTTLLRILAGLLRPTTGTVLLDGRPLRTSDVAARRLLGFLSHRSHMYDELTVRENLRFAARLHGLPDAEATISQALREVGLEERGNDRMSRLSRGLQQRGAISRAFLHAPQVLLLDEPFTALDGPSADRIRAWIAGRAANRCAVVLVTHQPGTIWDLATHVGVLALGRWAILEPKPTELEPFQRRYREAIRV
jgi:heme exporter protein A